MVEGDAALAFAHDARMCDLQPPLGLTTQSIGLPIHGGLCQRSNIVLFPWGHMKSPMPHPSRLTWFSPWLIMGFVCILAAILLVLAFKNIDRERAFMENALLSQANVLMRSIEAGSRAGMAGMGWGRRQIQVLMEETAQQPDVLYVAILNSKGEVIAHSEPDEIGRTAGAELPKGAGVSYGFREGEQESFEVVKAFQPWARHKRGRMRAWDKTDHMDITSYHGASGPLFVMVGLDPSPLKAAMLQDQHQTLLLIGILFLVGAAGFVSLVWAQHYRSARRSLRDIEAITGTIVSQMPVGLLVTDLQGRIRELNETARAILRDTTMGSDDVRIPPCFADLLHRLGREESILEEEIQCRLSDSRTVPVLANATIIHDGAKKPAGFAVLFSDLTGMKQLEEQLRRNERLAALGRLAAGVAHEIRNPLSSIKGFAAILANRLGQDENARKISSVMVQEVERINRVVSELLDFARPTDLHKGRHRCMDLLQRTEDLIEADARQRHVTLEFSVHPEDLQLEVDADRFSQTMLNLYLNAIEAMEAGGIITVEASAQEGEVVLRVSDSGRGIHPDHLPHVFDPYFTTKPEGVGLGLANVHKLVEAHGGDITVESRPGFGTTFVVRYPAPGSGDERVAASSAMPGAGEGGDNGGPQ